MFYAGSYGGLLTRINRRTGEQRAINVWPDNPMGFSSIGHHRALPVDVSDRDRAHRSEDAVRDIPARLETTNEGQTWERISPDLTRHDPATMGPSGGPITLDQTGVETYAVVFTLAPSPVDGSRDLGGVRRRLRPRDARWRQELGKVTPPDLPDFTRISLIEASPHDAGTAYFAGNRYQRADRAPYVYKTADYGKTWTQDRHAACRQRTSRARFARTRNARLAVPRHRERHLRVVRRRRRWQSLRELPVTPVHGIEVKGDDLVIATHGRSFYVLDNISRAAAGDPDDDRANPSSCFVQRTRTRPSPAACRSITTSRTPPTTSRSSSSIPGTIHPHVHRASATQAAKRPRLPEGGEDGSRPPAAAGARSRARG